MTHATTPAAFANAQPHADFGGPDFSVNWPTTSAGLCGRATNTSQTPKPAGGVQTLVQLAVLLAEAKHHRNLRQSKRASICEAELRAFRHDIMKRGQSNA